jgi:hypothetical protein
MNTFRRLLPAALLAFALSTINAGEPNQLTDVERRQGWRLLFDGKSTAGWEEITGKPFPTNCWTIDDGSLKALVRSDGFQDIRTIGKFGSFEMQFDWKVLKNGNSGVKYLVQRVDEWTNAAGRQARARGLEYQLADDANSDAASDPRRVAGSLYSVFAPAPRVAPFIGEFNHSLILVKGHHVEHWLNGTKVVDFETSATEVRKLLRSYLPKDSGTSAVLLERGPISLQNHATEAWFRNIKIRDIDP